MKRYDDALPEFAALARKALAGGNILDHIFLRDAAGLITFVILKPLGNASRDELREAALTLAPWVDPEVPVAEPTELFDESLREPTTGFLERIKHPAFDGFVRLVERRIVGQDWLRPPLDVIPNTPPVVVFASHKGGVGRSTALAVASVDLSRKGYNVLAIDLDLEAPGLGDTLLIEPPLYGTIDFFVESGVSQIDELFMDNLIAASKLAGQGLLHVAPAVGKAETSNPQNVLGKISRAYVEKVDRAGETLSFLDRTRELVKRLCERNSYDAVLVDARAGLNEATAAAILGLGADILLFGVDTPQTFTGYRYFLSHLARFRPEESGDSDWRYRLRMVQAKAQADPKSHSRFRTRAFDLFSDTIYDLEEGIDEKAFNFNYDDSTAPHFAWSILYDGNYAEVDPYQQGDVFSSHMYDRTFSPFINALCGMIGLSK